MKKILFLFLFIIFTLIPGEVRAQESSGTIAIPMNQYDRGKVEKVLEEGNVKIANTNQPYQLLQIKVLTGKDKNKLIKVDHGKTSSIKAHQKVDIGDEVVLTKIKKGNEELYQISDKFRLPYVILIAFGFLAVVIYFAKYKGLLSIIGMLLSLVVLVEFIVPAIATGKDPVLVSFLGATFIVLTSILLAHGFNKRTGIAVASTFITLLISIFLSYFFVEFAKLSGMGSEDASSFQFGQFAGINLKGLLLSGIIIGTLGVLDDITTAQSAAVDEIASANPKLSNRELYKKGISIGREHIVSLVNTLILAYAGASLPIFFLFSTLSKTQPLWVTLNSEFIVEEIIRALVGSTALVLAVPITTFLAANFFAKKIQT